MADPETISRDFVHLHVHTDYSMLDGCSRIDRLMERACDMNMRAVAITDHGNLHGALEFYEAAKAAGAPAKLVANWVMERRLTPPHLFGYPE